MDSIIQVSNITKNFQTVSGKSWFKSLIIPNLGKMTAVDNISFSLSRGEFVGFLGPNGAGKSTTIKMLTGILTPSSGKILVNNVVPYENRQKHAFSIGVVFGQRTQLWWDLPPGDSFNLLAKIYRIPKKKFDHNLDKFKKLLDLNSFMDIPVRKLSLGQKMRCELAAALLHDPEVLFLDEPTIGLDVFAKESIRAFLKEMNATQRTTVLLTTHDLDDVEDLCERVIIIDKGNIIEDGSLTDLKASFGNEKVIAFELDSNDLPSLPKGCNKIKSEGNVHFVSYTDIGTPELINDMLKRYRVHDISFVPLDINEVVKKAYQRGLSS